MAEPKQIRIRGARVHNLKNVDVDVPLNGIVGIAGVSDSGKTTLVLESLVPALEALTAKKPLPAHVKAAEAESIDQIRLIDASPIGINVRSTVATYANVHDELRKTWAKAAKLRQQPCSASDFSYNTGCLRCPACDGTGVISLDVQFLPDVEIPCPECRGSRYSREASRITRLCNGVERSLPDIMAMDVKNALSACADLKTVRQRLQTLLDLGLGYLTLGEASPSLSGGEAQRLKLASEMGRSQHSSVFVFDEPTISLHPLDVETLLHVFDRLFNQGATVIVIEHDADVIANADYVIDMGPGGGTSGGRIIAAGTPAQLAANPASVTGKYL